LSRPVCSPIHDDSVADLTDFVDLDPVFIEVVGPDRHHAADAAVAAVLGVLDPFGERVPDDVLGQKRKDRLDAALVPGRDHTANERDVLLRHRGQPFRMR
jgi:hypothetical protein